MGKSKAAKMKEITFATKCEVMDRQGNRSITGIYLADWNVDFHHYVQRGAGSGIGLAFNIIALTKEEHDRYHQHLPIMVHGKEMSWLEFKMYMEDYLKFVYPHWTENACHYHPMWEIKDYWDCVNGLKKG